MEILTESVPKITEGQLTFCREICKQIDAIVGSNPVGVIFSECFANDPSTAIEKGKDGI